MNPKGRTTNHEEQALPTSSASPNPSGGDVAAAGASRASKVESRLSTGRNAHQAIRQVQSFVKAGRRIAVDVDLAKFFDNVDQDVLMKLLGRRSNMGSAAKASGTWRGPRAC